MSEFWSEERITDYLDDRLSPADREMVEAHLQENPRDRETLEEFQQMRDALRGSPTYQLDDGFSRRVIQSIELLPATTDPLAPLPVKSPVKSTSSALTSNWRNTLGIVAALAATLLLGVFLIPWKQSADPVAAAGKNEIAKNEIAKNGNSGDVRDEAPDPEGAVTADDLVADDQPEMDDAGVPSRDQREEPRGQTESPGEAEAESFADEKPKAMKESEQSGTPDADNDMIKSEAGQSKPGEAVSPAARARVPDSPADRDDAGRQQFRQGNNESEEKKDETDPRWAGGADVRPEEAGPKRTMPDANERSPVQINGAELVVVTSSPGNRSIIESLDRHDEKYRRSAGDKTHEKRRSRDRRDNMRNRNDGGDSQRSRNRRRSNPEDVEEETDPSLQRNNTGMGNGQVDPPLQPTSMINAESVVFEIEATEEEFDEILKQVNAQRLTFNEADREALLTTVRGALPSDAAVGARKGRSGQSSRRGRSGGFDDGPRDNSESSKKDDAGPRIRRVKDLADWHRNSDGETSGELADTESETNNLNPDQMGVDSSDQPVDDLVTGRRQREQQKEKKSRPANVNEQPSDNQGQQQSESGEASRSDEENSQVTEAQSSGQEGLMLQQEIPQRRRYLLVINLVADGPAASSEVESENAEEGENVTPRPRSRDKK